MFRFLAYLEIKRAAKNSGWATLHVLPGPFFSFLRGLPCPALILSLRRRDQSIYSSKVFMILSNCLLMDRWFFAQ